MELYSVIKNDGPGGLLFWKFTGEDFRSGSQLIVAENEEALFVKDGVVVSSFSGGRFGLRTNNYPFIDTLRSSFSGGVSAFSCKVYFINKAHVMELYWGTDSPIAVIDPATDIMLEVQARGGYSVKVADAKKFVLKFVANNTASVGSDALETRFRTAFLQDIKETIATGLIGAGRDIRLISTRLGEFAGVITPKISSIFEEYGLETVRFNIIALDLVKNDNFAQMEAARAEFAVMGKRDATLNRYGQTWQRVQGRDILMTMAQNEGAAGAASGMGMGMGVGMAAGGAMSAIAGSVFTPFAQPSAPPQPAAPAQAVASRFAPKAAAPAAADAAEIECPACHKKSPAGTKFCGECGVKLPDAPAKAFCTSCGKELAPGAKFCGECGAKQ
ncbi:MAG: SPFH domain-containing protein [Opitutaceae bacterium]|jgi:membrane protease subunit (stomatin/prohibitin family)|nr:SPFH domain-containing protein [Opitutaceae bacterium]